MRNKFIINFFIAENSRVNLFTCISLNDQRQRAHNESRMFILAILLYREWKRILQRMFVSMEKLEIIPPNVKYKKWTEEILDFLMNTWWPRLCWVLLSSHARTHNFILQFHFHANVTDFIEHTRT